MTYASQSVPIKKDMTTFFYHVHIPKTGGTTVGNLLTAYYCNPYSPNLDVKLWYPYLCTQPCTFGLVDTFLSCYTADRHKHEHDLLQNSMLRAEEFKRKSGAQNLVYVTTLRRCQKRVISQ